MQKFIVGAAGLIKQMIGEALRMARIAAIAQTRGPR